MNERDLVQRLRARYPDKGWVVLPQVRNTTGYARVERTADVLVFGLWPSRGLELEGFELKVSRGDWLRELKDPAKAEAILQFCDRWWIVTPPGVVQKGELPPTWGLLVTNGTGLRVELPAPKLETPKEWGRSFVGAILRRLAEEWVPQTEVEPRIREAREKLQAELDRAVAAEVHLRSEVNRNASLVVAVRQFEAESGVRVDRWGYAGQGARFREALRLLSTPNAVLDELRRFRVEARRAADCAVEAVRCLEALGGEGQSFEHGGGI